MLSIPGQAFHMLYKTKNCKQDVTKVNSNFKILYS